MIKQIIEKLRYKLLLFIKTKRAIRKITRVFGLKNDLLLLLISQIRILMPTARLFGEDEKLDEVIDIAAKMLVEPRWLHDDSSTNFNNVFCGRYNRNSKEVDGLIANVRGNRCILEIMKSYWLVASLTADGAGDKERANYYLNKAKEIDPEAKGLTLKEFWQLRKKTKKESRRLRSEISDRAAIKLSLKVLNIGKIATLFSALFLITGYLYSKYFLGAFGIDVSKYFSLGDYISSSIDGIQYIVISALFPLIGYLLGICDASKMSTRELEKERRIALLNIYLFFITGIVSIILGYLFVLPELFYYGIVYCIIIVTFRFAYDVAKMFFKEVAIAAFILMLITIFSAYLFASISIKINKVEHGTLAELKRYRFTFDSDINASEESLILLASNSEYFFFRNMKEKLTIIVPKAKVILISTIKKK